MIYRIFSSKDTFVTDYLRGTPQTGSNVGGSEILQVFRVAPLSLSLGQLSGSSARILISFDLSGISELTASKDAPSSGITYYLRMKNAQHNETLPSSYDVEIFPLITDWDEGRGIDTSRWSDRGFANWDKPKSNVFWSNQGGDFTASLRAVAHFDHGDEDLYANVTHIVNAWLTGGLANDGFIVKLSSSLETGSSDYFVKMFHGRTTNFIGREPYLEAVWNDSLRDDRNNFVFDSTGSLFLYNRVKGQMVDIVGIGTGSNVMTVKISDLSGTVMTFSASHAGRTGIYSSSFAIPTGSYSGSTFTDVWFSGSRAYMTCSFTPKDSFAFCGSQVSQYFVSMPNLKNEYEGDEITRMNLFVRNKDYNPAVILTASSVPTGLVVTKAYYRIDDDRTDEVVVPFDTGSTESTRLSYDRDGDYFSFFMRSLPRGGVYRVVYLFDADGQRQIIDRGFKFRVV